MAQAVLSLFPEAKLGIGPAIEDGFYYDFELPRPLIPEDLPEIEARIREIITSDVPFLHEEIDRAEARRLFSSQPYKLELIDELADAKVGIYRQGSFVDLCRGPHVPSSGEIRAFKLTSLAGAYWRGDEHRPMLQRIYGVAFETQEALEDYLAKSAEATRRDHRKLGRELDLYSLHEEAGPGLVFWHPKGAVVRRLIEEFWTGEHLRRGYDIVYTPHMGKLDLWRRSGHWDFYRENLYSPMDVEGQGYILKPMNCLGHILIYKTRKRSYRELPMRFAEMGTVYRYERSGVLHGLARVRGFTQDDAHIFCRPDQLRDELVGVLELARFMMTAFGFEQYEIMLSTRPDKYTGTEEMWEESTTALQEALLQLGLPYEVDEGQGVFYGPKIDIKLKDALGRAWQGPTIQVDFNLPQRFEVTYINEQGGERPVVMVHRAVLGSLERFMACLVEHYGGAFPVWLTPQQAVIIPIADRHLDYAHQVEVRLKEAGLRVAIDQRSERMNQKIREAQLEKIPFMLVVGDREQESATVSVRRRSGEQAGAQSLEDFIALVQSEARSRK
jgi:threonyl-tRNA synthetase